MKNGESRLLRTDDIRRYLQDKKGEIKERTRRWSMCSDSSDCSVKSNSSLRSLPQYSSYRAFSSQGSFNKMSGLPTKAKSAKVVPRGQAQAAGSKEEISNGRSSGIPTPGAVSRENSFTKSQLPVFKRETSTPNMKRESSIPQIKREDSSPQIRSASQKYTQKTPSRPSSAQPAQKKETPSLIKREGSLSQIKKNTPSAVRPRGTAATATKSTPPGEQKQEVLKVGDRVNISGSTKKGVIQFIGETRFAKGDWAGVVLDEPVGKNDGTVAGVRYFQCQPNYGVFVKVEKLLKLADISDPGYKPHDSQTPDKSTQLKPPTATPKVTPVRSAENTEIPDNLSVGDKVSIGEARIGYLRYLGETGFAKGIWCGVELQEPLGKNDGAVAGTRYFQCEAKYGLFAPVHKVKKIEDGQLSSTEPKTEITTETNAVPKEIQKKEKDEDTNNDSGVASNLENQDSSVTLVNSSMQLQLQDRENEIKKLLKDREVDRIESQKFLEQYQQSENKLTSMRISQDKLQRDNDDEIKRLQSLLSNSEKVKVSYETQLEEERRKLEDLQFQLEEQMVTKELSLEADKENNRLLEETLASKNIVIEQLEKELQNYTHTEEELKNKYSDLEFQLAETNEREIQSSQSLAVLQDKLKSLEDVLNEAQSESNQQTSHLTTELERRDLEIEQVKEDVKIKENAITDLDFQIKKYRDELNDTIEAKGALNKEIFDLTSKLKEKDSEYTTLQSNFEKIKNENYDVKQRVKNAETKVENLSAEKLKMEEEVSQLTKSSGDSSSQISFVNEQLQQTKREFTALQDEKSALAINVETLLQKIEEIKETSSKEKASLERENGEKLKRLEETITSLNANMDKQKQKQTELEAELEKSSKREEQKDKEHEMISKQLLEREEQLEAKNAEIDNFSKNAKESTSAQMDLQNQIQKLQTESDEKSNEIEKLLQLKTDEDKSKASLQSTQDEMQKELEALRQEGNSIKEQYENILKAKDAQSQEIIESKQVCAKKETTINDLEAEKRQIEDKKKAADLKCLEVIENNKELNNQLLFAHDENTILKDKINQMQTDISQGSDVTGKLQHELSIMKEEVYACKSTITDLETTRNKLEERCECLNSEKVQAYMESNKLLTLKTTLEEEIKSLKNELKESTQREVNTRTSLEDDRIKLQDSVESTLSQLQQKEGELSSWRVKAQQLEKKVLEQDQYIQTLQNSATNGTVETSDEKESENDLKISKLKEELENKTNEVMFLNTVVVDIQNKFKTAEEKIRLLEEGEGLFAESEGLDDTVSPVRPGLKQRLFCDICDEFDLHETEDCPTQSSMDDSGTQYHAPRGEERPYCTICEVFGHKTEDCDDEETF